MTSKKAEKAEKKVEKKAEKKVSVEKKSAGGAENGYPFQTKQQLVARVQSDDKFMLLCLGIVFSRQTSGERDKRNTKGRNGHGFMSSHAAVGTDLGVKAGEGKLTPAEVSKARSIVSRYGKQLAEHFRTEALKSDPSLKKQAAVFGL